MTDRIWHQGPPPHVGWWNAATIRDSCAWRWWNGHHWSMVVYPHHTLPHVEVSAITRASWLDIAIEWTDYWPPNARCARLNPDTGEVTGAGPMPAMEARDADPS